MLINRRAGMGDMGFSFSNLVSAGTGALKSAAHLLPIPTTKKQLVATVLAPEIAIPYLTVRKAISLVRPAGSSASAAATPAAPAEDPHRYDNIDMSGANRAATAAGNLNSQFHAWVAAGSPVAPSGAPILPGPSGTSVIPSSVSGGSPTVTLPDGTPLSDQPVGFLGKLAALSTPMKLGIAIGAAGVIYLGVKHFGGGAAGHAPKSAEPVI